MDFITKNYADLYYISENVTKELQVKHFGVSLMKKLSKVIFVTGKIKFIRIKSAQNVPMIEKHFLLYHDLEADKEIKLIRENTMQKCTLYTY